ncbi:MAG: hypothetical protein KKG93_01180, partial [Bacteroidetes bacterium]|nr:hypothetical protein [Bacteroidota bacterium]
MNEMIALYKPSLISSDVMVDQRRKNNALIDDFIGEWNGVQFENHGVPFSFPYIEDETKVLGGSQVLLSSPNEKYKKWTVNYEDDEVDVTNHHTFTIDPSMQTLTSQFEYTYSGVSVINSNENTSSSEGLIQFKDPWLIDYPDSLYGYNLRNRGMDDAGPDKLEFKSRPSPFYPDSSTSYNGDVYQGVFLLQTPDLNDPGKPYYSVKATSPQPLYVQGKNRQFYFHKWEGTGASFQSSANLETPVVFNQANATVKAVMKGTQLSSMHATYNKNNQRKFVRSANGDLWNLYESMGSTWLERSSDNGNTWDLAKEYHPNFPQFPHIFTDSNMKNASICLSPDGDKIGVAYQEYNEYENKNRISIDLYNIETSNLLEYVGSYTIRGDAYGNDYIASTSATPVISSGSFYGVEVYHVAWVGSNGTESGIYYSCIHSSMNLLGSVTKIPNTNSDSQNPTIASKNNDVDLLAHIAWQQGWSYIQYSRMGVYSGWSGYFNVVDNFATISTGDGFPTNFYPSITTSSSGYPIVAWVGTPYYNSSYTKIIRRTKSSSGWSSTFGQYGSNTPLYPQINMAGTMDITAWTESSGAVKFLRWNSVWSFGTSGRYIQLANAPDLNTMYGSVLNTTSSPYPFTTTTSVGTTYKVSAASFNQGRGVVAREDTTQFFFVMGDVSLNGGNIGFVELPDTLIIKKK